MRQPKPRIVIQFCCTAEQRDAYKRRAAAKGLTLSQFIRHKLRAR